MFLTWHRSMVVGLFGLFLFLGASAQSELKSMPPLVLDDLSPAIQQAIVDAEANLQSLQSVEVDTPTLAWAFGQLGDVLLVHGLVGPAKVAYQNAQQLEPRRLDWAYLLSVVAEGEGDVGTALSLLNQVLSLDPFDRVGLIRRGRLFLAQGQTAQAKADFQRAVQLDPDSAAAQAGLGEVALQEQRFTDAAMHLEQALDLQPSATRLYQPLGLAYRGTGRLDEARAVMTAMGDRDVAFIDPVMDRVREQSRSPQFYQEAALDAADMGDLVGARTLLIQALTLAPNDPLIVSNYGEVLAREGLLPQAREAFLRLMELQPNAPDTWFYLAQTEELLGRLEAATMAYQRLVELDPQDSRASEGLAFVALAKGQYRDARAQFQSLADQASEATDRARFRYWQAMAVIGLQQYSAADALLQQLMDQDLAADRDILMARARLHATVLGSDANIAKAFEWANAVYDATPDVESAATLAMVYAKQGEYLEAQDYQAQAMFEALRDGFLERRGDLKEEMDSYRLEQPTSRPFGSSHPVFSHRRLD